MTKIIYPEPGLTSNQKEKMENVKKLLDETAGISLDVPDSFSKAAYLKELPSKIDSYQTDHNNIDELLLKTDNSLKNLNQEINSNFKGTDNIKIPKRESIIKG